MNSRVLIVVATLATCCVWTPTYADESFSLRLVTGDGTVTCRPDGTERVEKPADRANGALPNLTRSPNGTQSLFVRDGAIHLGDADGNNAARVSPGGLEDAGAPAWSPDGRRIAFVARHGDVHQIHVMDRDGRNEYQITRAHHGVWQPRFGPDGRLAYLVFHERKTKLQPADLVVTDIDNVNKFHEQPLAKNMYINTYAWSPDGKSIAYSSYGSLVFHDLATNEDQEIRYPDIDPRLNSHAASAIAWRPDGRAVACPIRFLGGRQQGGPPIFGDTHVFVIPRDGKPTWFNARASVRAIDWVTPAKG